MAYRIRAVTSIQTLMWNMQDVLRDPTGSAWTYLDGRLSGVDNAASGDWNAVVDPDVSLLDGDYIVMKLPGSIGADEGVVKLLMDLPGTQVELHAHTAGWDSGIPGPKVGDVDLGSVIPAVIGGAATELRVISNSTRALIFGMDGALIPPFFGHLGFIQSHYADPGDSPDPNPLMVCGEQKIPGDAAPNAPLYRMVQINPAVAATFIGNVRTLLDTGGADMLTTMQFNRRENPPIPSRSLIPCLVGNDVALNTEIRGELEGVFFYGPPASLAPDTEISRSDGTYILIADIVVGPVG